MSENETKKDESVEKAPEQKETKGYPNLILRDLPEKGDGAQLSFTKKFHAEYTDPDDGSVHTGQFTIERLTLGAKSRMGIEESILCGGLRVNTLVQIINQRIAYLLVAITDSPDWWNPKESYDEELIEAMFMYITEWEGSFRRRAMAGRRT